MADLTEMNDIERELCSLGYRFVAGVDEVGRGPLAGPVVAAAVIFPPYYVNPSIKDSKALTPMKREQIYWQIMNDAESVGWGIVESHVVDEVNIWNATVLAMKKALSALSISPDYVLVDGNRGFLSDIPQCAIVKGDNRCISIAAASIVAKVIRDRVMDIYHHEFPQYNFQKNKGYATQEHRWAIRRHGYCRIHRRSFLVRDLV
ncbi:MAG: ribonuclease HII [Syntrophales bacterium]|nr:ribonuclease HII [Syntrophales bacterium]